MDFDWGEIGKVFSYLIPVIMFLLFNVLFKKQREQQRRVAVVKSLLSETNYNIKLVDSSSFQFVIRTRIFPGFSNYMESLFPAYILTLDQLIGKSFNCKPVPTL